MSTREGNGPVEGLVARVADHFLRRTGLWLSGSRAAALRAAVQATASGLSHDEYLTHIEEGGGLYEEVLEMLTVGETYFFRGEAQLDFIQNTVLPDLRGRSRSGRLRIWSAGCSTGDEPYTLAILGHEAGLLERLDILGTDISRRAIETARQGRFRRWSLRSTDAATIQRYFTEEKAWFVLRPEIRDAVEFRRMNLLDDPYPPEPGGFDVILCRNVLMYLHPERAMEVGCRVADSLRDGGWLLLGGSDPILSDLGDRCRLLLTDAGLVYRKGRAETGRAATPRTHVSIPSTEPPGTSGEVDPARLVARLDDPLEAPPYPAHPSVEDPPQQRDVVARALTLYERGNATDALRLVDEAADGRVWLSYARTLADCGDLGNAREVLVLGLDRYPLDAELRLLHGFVLGECNQLTEAVHAARSAIYLDRHSLVAHLLLASLLSRMGEAKAAERAQREARRLMAFSGNPHDPPRRPSLEALP